MIGTIQVYFNNYINNIYKCITIFNMLFSNGCARACWCNYMCIFIIYTNIYALDPSIFPLYIGKILTTLYTFLLYTLIYSHANWTKCSVHSCSWHSEFLFQVCRGNQLVAWSGHMHNCSRRWVACSRRHMHNCSRRWVACSRRHMHNCSRRWGACSRRHMHNCSRRWGECSRQHIYTIAAVCGERRHWAIPTWETL